MLEGVLIILAAAVGVGLLVHAVDWLMERATPWPQMDPRRYEPVANFVSSVPSGGTAPPDTPPMILIPPGDDDEVAAIRERRLRALINSPRMTVMPPPATFTAAPYRYINGRLRLQIEAHDYAVCETCGITAEDIERALRKD